MGALALTILMIPVVVRSTEEMLKLVPNELREASLALGIPKWRTILKVVLPTAIGGITTGGAGAHRRCCGLSLGRHPAPGQPTRPFAPAGMGGGVEGVRAAARSVTRPRVLVAVSAAANRMSWLSRLRKTSAPTATATTR